MADDDFNFQTQSPPPEATPPVDWGNTRDAVPVTEPAPFTPEPSVQTTMGDNFAPVCDTPIQEIQQTPPPAIEHVESSPAATSEVAATSSEASVFDREPNLTDGLPAWLLPLGLAGMLSSREDQVVVDPNLNQLPPPIFTDGQKTLAAEQEAKKKLEALNKQRQEEWAKNPINKPLAVASSLIMGTAFAFAAKKMFGGADSFLASTIQYGAVFVSAAGITGTKLWHGGAASQTTKALRGFSIALAVASAAWLVSTSSVFGEKKEDTNKAAAGVKASTLVAVPVAPGIASIGRNIVITDGVIFDNPKMEGRAVSMAHRGGYVCVLSFDKISKEPTKTAYWEKGKLKEASVPNDATVAKVMIDQKTFGYMSVEGLSYTSDKSGSCPAAEAAPKVPEANKGAKGAPAKNFG